MSDRVKLGATVRDEVSGLEGRVVAITSWVYGCERLTIQPLGNKDGKPHDTFSIDEPQATVVSEPNKPAAAPAHGDRPDVGQRPDIANRVA